MFIQADQFTNIIASSQIYDKKAEKNSFNALLQESLLHYKSTENKIPCIDSLIDQQINPEIRSRMASWMIEVFSKCGSGSNTFFLAVHIMDYYLKNGPQNLGPDQIHIIGIVSMFIASKFEDVTPIGMNALVKYISHGKYTEKQIVKLEIDIAVVLEFDFKIYCSCDYLGLIATILRPHLVISRTAEIILILTKLEYNHYYPPCEEAAASLIIAARSLNQYELVEKVYRICDFTEEDLDIYILSIKNYIDGLKIKPKFSNALRELGASLETMDSYKIFKFSNPSLESDQANLISLFN